jgi:two-component system cell cycle sensor histidine kinase/response regulator CckA
MAIVTVIAAYSYLDGQAFRHAANSADRSRSLVEQNQELLSLLMVTGVNQTGYLLTGDARYLAAYNLALSKVSLARRVLRRPEVASPEECARLDALIAARLEDLAQTLRIRQQGDVASALQRADRGHEATDQIRALGAHIIAYENTQFRERTSAALRHGYQARIVVQLGALVLFGLLWTATRRIDRLLRAQNQIVSDLELARQREARGSAALATTLRGIEESESRYRLLFEANPQPMWVFDRDTLAFLAVNHAAIARYGYSREEFLGMTLRDIRPPEDVPAMLEHIRVSTATPHTDGPWRHRRKDGSILIVEVASHPIQFGDAAASLVMASDITEHKRLEDELRQSQKLEAVGQLAGGIAHDFNNLLTVIEGYADMIRADQAPEDPHRESVQEILLAAQRAASLTRQLLAFSRRQILQPIRLNLNANVASTQRMLSRLLGENIQIHTELASGLWDVFADPGQMDQILLNLAVNARDAMPSGGVLTIETADVECGASLTLGLAEGEYVRLSLGDTGEGMDEETQRHIFEPFFTTKEVGRGTGLGLSTVYGIVKQSEGDIQVSSQPGNGSSFSIYLPRAVDVAPPGPKGASDTIPAQHGGETILVVEDDETVRHLVMSMLKTSGYSVIAPATPSEALRICGEFSTPLDLLLTDMVLPETDGAQVAEMAVASRPNLRVLFMSGYTEHPVLRLPGFDRGAPFIQKPFSKAALTAKVREVLQAT